MYLLKQYPATFDLKKQPSCKRRIVFKELRQSASGASTAAFAVHLYVAHSLIVCDAHVADKSPKAERAPVRMLLLRAFEPAVQLTAIDTGGLLNFPDRFPGDVAQYGLLALLEHVPRRLVKLGIGDSGPGANVDRLQIWSAAIHKVASVATNGVSRDRGCV